MARRGDDGRGREPRAPHVGVGCLVVREGALLVILRAGSHGAETWSTPSGSLEFGESPEACAVRVTLEETDVKVTAPTFVAVTNDVFVEEQRHDVTLWFEARHVSGEPRVASEAATAVEWRPLDRLPGPMFPPLNDLLSGRCWPPPSEHAASWLRVRGDDENDHEDDDDDDPEAPPSHDHWLA